ncbi:MAG: hypothetical protein ACPGWM_08255 [Flavobacteriales bacterium]
MGRTGLILIAFIFLMFHGFSMSAQQGLPRTSQAVKLYESGDLVGAKEVILDALQKEEEQNHPYTWCVKGFIFKEIYKTIENKDRYSSNRDIAIDALKTSIRLDTNKEYENTNLKALEFLANTLYNDVVYLTRGLNEYNVEEPEKFYKRYKTVWRLVEPNADFTDKDVELFRVMAEGFNKIYKSDPERNAVFFDKSATYYKKAISLKGDDTVANYNLAILYYNRGVFKIKKIDSNTEIFELITIQDECIELFKQSLPYMKKAHELDSTRKEPLKGLRAIYKSLSEDQEEEKYRTLLERYIKEGVIQPED